MTQRAPEKMPPGLAIGMAIVTNRRYANAHRRSPPNRKGVLLGTRWDRSSLIIQLEGVKHPVTLHRNFFDLVEV
jgi:hypothetical protein